MGESGSGKSTIVKAIMGLLGEEGLVTRGDIWYKGENLTDMSEKKLRKLSWNRDRDGISGLQSRVMSCTDDRSTDT